jgi:FkbM family methyltransferase
MIGASPITTSRKRRLAEMMLSVSGSRVGFVDVGAGGPLKMPWTLLPADRVNKLDFEPQDGAATTPLCVSDHAGRGRLFVARDARSSSLHPTSDSFVRRFDNDGTVSTHAIEVDCVTLDTFLSDQRHLIDLIDINAEGHDFRILQGATRLLSEGPVSLIRIEVLLTEVWRGQGWFSDIDHCLRSAGYDLVTMNLDFERPASVRQIYHEGEVLWGKALYVPSADAWTACLTQAHEIAAVQDRVLKAVVLYVLTEALGRAADLIAAAERVGALRRVTPDDLRRRIRWVFQYAEIEARARDIVRPLNVRKFGGALARLVTSRLIA